MANEFDIGQLIPPAVRRVNLLIRLKSSSVYIEVSSAEGQPGTHGGVLGGTTLWRKVSGPVLIRVPTNIQIVLIDADADLQ